MNEEIIYFELNNWMPNKDYPNKENKLVVVRTIVDMSANWCITATKEWVLKNCPELLTKYTKFLRCPDADEELPYGRFGSPFYEYTNENIGWHFIDDEDY